MNTPIALIEENYITEGRNNVRRGMMMQLKF